MFTHSSPQMTTESEPKPVLKAQYAYASSDGNVFAFQTIEIPVSGTDLESLASQLPQFQSDINAYLTERIASSTETGPDEAEVEKLERTVLDGDEEIDDDDDEEDEDK
ncbi:hypothetical protein V1512DRAFT_277189 [Lipomyces arxii]|uniref:uncharacterized protein n=1 Tax=Lipomyces arxii TaxID=56418 RepID=UPI0034CE8C94